VVGGDRRLFGSDERSHCTDDKPPTLPLSWHLIVTCIDCTGPANYLLQRQLNNLSAAGNSTPIELTVKPVIVTVVCTPRPIHYEARDRLPVYAPVFMDGHAFGTTVLTNAIMGPPLWSSGQSSWLQIQRSLVRFPAQPDFLRSSGSGKGSTQPREDN
jgi:hypothetical protein